MVENITVAKTVEEALSSIGKGFSPLAGGTEVNRLGSFETERNYVSLKKIADLKIIEKCAAGGPLAGFVRIGAMATFQEAVESPSVPDYIKKACLSMSSPQRRNMATLAGNLASARDDSYIIPALLASGAEVCILGADGKESRIPVSEYLFGSVGRDKIDGGLISAILVREKASVVQKRFSNTAGSHAYLTMAAGSAEPAGHSNSRSGGASGGVASALCLKNTGIYFFPDSVLPGAEPKDDFFGSAEYKKYLVDVTREDFLSALGLSERTETEADKAKVLFLPSRTVTGVDAEYAYSEIFGQFCGSAASRSALSDNRTEGKQRGKGGAAR